MDNFYSSPYLFYDLKKIQTVAVGTFRTNRKGVPKRIRDAVLKGKGDSKVILYLNNISILKVFNRKAVTLMSTVYNSKNTDTGKKHFQTKETIQKPLIMIKYNKYMGGVDANDQLLKYSHFSKRTIKWWKKVFFRMLNIFMVDAFILWKEHLKKKSEAYKNTQTDFRVSVIDKLVNNSFEIMNDSLDDSLNNSFVGEFERLADNKHFLKKIPVPENSKKGKYFEHAKYARLLRENSIISDLYQNVNVLGVKHNMNAPNVKLLCALTIVLKFTIHRKTM